MTRVFTGLKALSRLALATGLITAVCLTSCKKTAPDAGMAKDKQARATAADMKMSLEEIYARLPQTIMHNLSGSFKMDASRAEWIYEKDYVLVRIPVNDAVNKSYIYAAKYYNDPMGKPRVFLSQFLPERGSDMKDFTGKQMWLNLQDWTFYGVQFEHNKPTGYMQPVAIDPAWEAEMLDAGLFYLDADDKIAANPDVMQILQKRGGVFDCPDNVNKGSGGGFFGWLGGILGGWLNGLGGWLSSGGGSSSGSVDGGGIWIVGWPDGGNTGLPNGGGGHYGGGGGYHPGEGPSGDGYDSSEDPTSPDYNPPIDVWGHNYDGLWASAEGVPSGPVYGTGSLGNATVDYLAVVLDLNAQQKAWLLAHLDKAHRMKAYMLTAIPNLTLEEKNAIMKEHLERMRTDPAYFTFVNNYDQNNTGMWWMNEDWVNDLENFELTPNGFLGISATWRTLTAQEKALVKLYPVQAFIIFTRFGTAQNVAEHETNLPNKINGKQNAFCHAFFQAISVRDMVPRFSPVYMSRAQIVTLFSTAHESEVPPILTLEKQMDLFNNWVGIAYGESVSIFTLDNTLRDGILGKVSNGELKYLTPLDTAASHPYDDNGDKIQDCPTCLNGIVPATQIKPTNQ